MLEFKLKQPYYRQPPGGWHLPKDGHNFGGDTPEQVCERVDKYLIQNGRAPGNTRDELTLYVHLNWPWLTEPNLEYNKEMLPTDHKYDSLKEVFSWLGQLKWLKNYKPVEAEVASHRLDVCEKCPHNRCYSPDDDLTSPISRMAYLFLRRRPEPRVGWCVKWKWDNRVAAQIKEEVLGKADPSVPGCWRA